MPETPTVSATAEILDLAERFSEVGGTLLVALRAYEHAHATLSGALESFDEDPTQPLNFYSIKDHVEYIGECDALRSAREAVPSLTEDALFVLGALRAARDAAETSGRLRESGMKGGGDA